MIRYTPLQAHADFVLIQEGKGEHNKSGARPCSSRRGQGLGDVPGLVGPLLALHRCAATRRPATTLEAGVAAWRLIKAAATGTVAKGGATIDRQGVAGGFVLILVPTITEAEHLLAIVHLGAASGAAAVFPKHPHEEGRIAVKLEVEGALPAQAARAGEHLLTAGQSDVACDGDLKRDPRSLAAATVCLQPEPAWTGGRQLTGKEARELEPDAGRIL